MEKASFWRTHRWVPTHSSGPLRSQTTAQRPNRTARGRDGQRDSLSLSLSAYTKTRGLSLSHSTTVSDRGYSTVRFLGAGCRLACVCVCGSREDDRSSVSLKSHRSLALERCVGTLDRCWEIEVLYLETSSDSRVLRNEAQIASPSLRVVGKLGHGDELARDTPKKVTALAHARVATCGGGCEHSACITRDGELWCWGQACGGFASALDTRQEHFRIWKFGFGETGVL